LPKVKICGNRTPEDIRHAEGADFMGFIVEVEGSRRSLSIEQARPLFRMASDCAATVAVVRKTERDFLRKVQEELEPDFIQIHRELTPQELKEIDCGARIIALVKPDTHAEERALRLRDYADVLMTDTFIGGVSGGTGLTHDWNISRAVRDAIKPHPFMLSGGLTPQNVAEAVRAVRPAIVDVSSGVEANGAKSRELVLSFIERARGS